MLGVNRSRVYYKPAPQSEFNLQVMDWIDRQYTDHPTTGVLGMVDHIALKQKVIINPKRVRRLMRTMNLMAVYPKPRTTLPNVEHKVFPFLLRRLKVIKPNQVWCTDITYIRLLGGFMYLIAIMDLYSRYVISWRLSNSMDLSFCLDALDDALRFSECEIFHSDQGSQYTSPDFTKVLLDRGIKVSMSGKGRCFDNIVNERLWRTVKYEEIFLHEYADGHDLNRHLERYFDYYNFHRPHRSLSGLTPGMVYGSDVGLWDALNLCLSSKAAGSSRLLRRLTASHVIVKADADATKQTGLISQQY